jgi:hypothetical protein
MAEDTTKTLRGPDGIRLVLDRKEIVPDDPGDGTPALVWVDNYSSTLAAAQGEGELLGSRDAKQLTDEQLAWLDEVSDAADDWLYGKRGE